MSEQKPSIPVPDDVAVNLSSMPRKSEQQKPSIGRIVHLYSQGIADRDQTSPGYGFNGQGAGPYLAHVTQVFEADGEVTYCNLYVIPPFGDPFHQGSVPLKGSRFDHGGIYWEWPPRVAPLPAVPEAQAVEAKPIEPQQAATAALGGETPKTTGLDFGEAIAVLKRGGRVARVGWNGKGMWLLLIPECHWETTRGLENLDGLPWIGMKTADDKFVPWLASQTDVLAEDWQVVTS